MSGNLVWRYGDPSKVPEDVKYAIGVALGGAAFHPCVRALLLDVAASFRRTDRNERRRAQRSAAQQARTSGETHG